MKRINDQTIILIGFKNVGKSTIGKALAKQLHRDFFDLDTEIEVSFKKQYSTELSVREIVKQHGEALFRLLEHQVLGELLTQKKSAILSLGGGSIVEEENQKLLTGKFIIYLTASREQLFERMVENGRPAFFSTQESTQEAFDKLWEKRTPIYEALATYTVDNSSCITSCLTKIIKKIEPKKLLLMHGPNLNKLGKRNINHYGTLTLIELENLVAKKAKEHNIDVICYQSNHEGALIDTLQAESEHCLGIIINPGAFTHYSYALYDALLDTELPIVEVHLSAIDQREKWRSVSVTASACITAIWGKKEQGYLEAIDILMEHIQNEN